MYANLKHRITAGGLSNANQPTNHRQKTRAQTQVAASEVCGLDIIIIINHIPI